MNDKNDPLQPLDDAPVTALVKTVKLNREQDEYVQTKDNLEQIIDLGSSALTELKELARRSEDMRAYRVLSELISSLVIANKSVMEIKALNVDAIGGRPQTVNNNLIVGSTAEILRALERAEEQQYEHQTIQG